MLLLLLAWMLVAGRGWLHLEGGYGEAAVLPRRCLATRGWRRQRQFDPFGLGRWHHFRPELCDELDERSLSIDVFSGVEAREK